MALDALLSVDVAPLDVALGVPRALSGPALSVMVLDALWVKVVALDALSVKVVRRALHPMGLALPRMVLALRHIALFLALRRMGEVL